MVLLFIQVLSGVGGKRCRVVNQGMQGRQAVLSSS